MVPAVEVILQELGPVERVDLDLLVAGLQVPLENEQSGQHGLVQIFPADAGIELESLRIELARRSHDEPPVAEGGDQQVIGVDMREFGGDRLPDTPEGLASIVRARGLGDENAVGGQVAAYDPEKLT